MHKEMADMAVAATQSKSARRSFASAIEAACSRAATVLCNCAASSLM